MVYVYLAHNCNEVDILKFARNIWSNGDTHFVCNDKRYGLLKTSEILGLHHQNSSPWSLDLNTFKKPNLDKKYKSDLKISKMYASKLFDESRSYFIRFVVIIISYIFTHRLILNAR